MGSSQSKKIVANDLSESYSINCAPSDKTLLRPMATAEVQYIFQKHIEEEFNKLYIRSRDVLHVASNTSKHHFIHNTSRYSKSLSECCNDMEVFSQSIADAVTERLGATGLNEYTVPNTDSKSVDHYISSRNSTQYDDLKQPPAQGNVIPSCDRDGSLDTDTDVL